MQVCLEARFCVIGVGASAVLHLCLKETNGQLIGDIREPNRRQKDGNANIPRIPQAGSI
jgi:hypothetical protein